MKMKLRKLVSDGVAEAVLAESPLSINVIAGDTILPVVEEIERPTGSFYDSLKANINLA
jgi:hypothetical protein